jgi:hypothetical protein
MWNDIKRLAKWAIKAMSLETTIGFLNNVISVMLYATNFVEDFA